MADPTILTLTNAEPSDAEFRSSNVSVDSSRGLSITFDFYAYGGTGGDGISFFFIDGSKSPIRAGAFGGSLGYAQSISDGIAGLDGGYLGIGFDEFGNFSGIGSNERIDGPGGTSDAIAVRGSQATNYKYLDGTRPLPISLDNPGIGATRDNSKRTAKIDLSPTGLLTVAIDLNADGDAIDPNEQVITVNVIEKGNGALPATFKFGFAASTGGSNNIHEVGNFDVRTADGTPIPVDFTNSIIVVGDSGSTGEDTLTGSGGNDIVVGGDGSDVLTGGAKADRFVFSGSTKRGALKTSTLNARDSISDFNHGEGDRFQLDFDNNLNTVELPKGLFYAGTQKGSLLKATRAAYADRDFKKKGNQRLKADEAVFFKLGKRTYLSVNDNRTPFSAGNDLLADVTGTQFKSGDLKKSSLAVRNYFV
ncbi:MAG: hypothetical protein HC769_36240 [Cyanobacteria bacterium CRU_2_1]|nr:hypothetical protein [Cyanobacteria bacterium RU_5_0]NJR63745.1 hypothetical protein [Cyanobacteria bacterium CRU_2_1]